VILRDEKVNYGFRETLPPKSDDENNLRFKFEKFDTGDSTPRDDAADYDSKLMLTPSLDESFVQL
jgi:hypothetical protein